MSPGKALLTRIAKIRFFWWAKRQGRIGPCSEALSIWSDSVRYAQEAAGRDFLGDLPHILEKDRNESWWRFPNSYPFMYGLARRLGPSSYLEIGTRYGYSLAAVCLGAKETLRAVTSIDLEEYEDRSQRYAEENLRSKGYAGSSEFIAGSSHDPAVRAKIAGRAYDLVFVDGDHSYEGAANDILHYWTHVRPGGFMIIDDVLWQVFSNGKRVLRAVKDTVPGLEGVAFAEFIGAGVRRKRRPEYGVTLDDFIDRRTGLAAFYRGLYLIKKQE